MILRVELKNDNCVVTHMYRSVEDFARRVIDGGEDIMKDDGNTVPRYKFYRVVDVEAEAKHKEVQG